MKITISLACLLFTMMARAQLLKVSAGTDLTILSGTVFKTEGFTLTPSADFIISDNSIIKSATVTHTSAQPYISRVYQFTNNTNPYSGSVQINYTDGAELNGIPENSLMLNVHNGTSWSDYPVALPAAGNSSTASNYSYLHTTPATGINYYRILQTDINNRSSYRVFRVLKFTADDASFTIIKTPVTNNVLTVRVNTVTGLALYTTGGTLLWQEQVNAGTKDIDVSRYPKGVYLLKANSNVQKILIQ